MTQVNDIIFNRQQAADYMKFSYGTLAVWACNKTYDLKYSKVGASVRYRKSDCDEFLNARLVKPLKGRK